ncbi:MAG: amino acid transporter permease [Rickettsiaceae bacterium]|jgi:polar amino acid transport system permease protein|nr:amino acid transporter permease [Rickettsiaceae bacterium]
MLNSLGYYVDIAISISKGIPVTLLYSVLSVTFGFFIGAFLAFLKVSNNRLVNIFAEAYTSIFRGTPLLIQLSVVVYAIPPLLNIKLSLLQGGVIAFSLNSGAYVSEIIRAGIQSVDKGQFEAAKSLGIPYSLTMKDIILPQAVRNVLPSLVNELINMLKESALISVLGEADIMRLAQLTSARTYDYFTPLLIAGFYYYILILILSYIGKVVERKMKI